MTNHIDWGRLSFDERLIIWFGMPEGREKDLVYRQNLQPEVRRRFQQSAAEARAAGTIRQHPVLIVIVSTAELVTFNIDAYRPTHVYLLASAKMATRSEEVRQAVYSDAEYDEYYQREGSVTVERFADDTGAIDIYRTIKQIRDSHPDQSLVIDVTGGNSSMKVGAALAGTWLGVTLSMIETSYGSVPGRPGNYLIPGTQRPVVVDDPYHVFGDHDRRRALTRMHGYDYRGAVDDLTQIVERLGNSHGDRHRLLLAEAYLAWEAFDLTTAGRKLEELVALPGMPDDIDRQRLSGQIALLKKCSVVSDLKEPQRSAYPADADYYRARAHYFNTTKKLLKDPAIAYGLLAMLLAAARRRAAQERYDIAFLVLYRTLEFLGQQRLAERNMVAENWRSDRRKLESYAESLEKPLGPNAYKNIPGLLDKWRILLLIQDPVSSPQLVDSLESKTGPRNASIFAHGFQTVDREQYEELLNLTMDLVRSWQQHKPLAANVRAAYDAGAEFLRLGEADTSQPAPAQIAVPPAAGQPAPATAGQVAAANTGSSAADAAAPALPKVTRPAGYPEQVVIGQVYAPDKSFTGFSSIGALLIRLNRSGKQVDIPKAQLGIGKEQSVVGVVAVNSRVRAKDALFIEGVTTLGSTVVVFLSERKPQAPPG